MKILGIKRLNNSYYGNPRYEIIAKDYKGNIISGKTMTNGAIGYSVDSSMVGKNVKFDYHQTRSGNIIFDRIKSKR